MTDLITRERHADAHVARPPFVASERLADHLQQLLVDLTELALQGKQAHWNVVGRNFRDLHLQLDEVVDAAREFTDRIAERMRALHVTPDGSSRTVADRTGLEGFPAGEVDSHRVVELITAATYAVVGTARRIHDDVDAEDPTTADQLHGIIERLEQLAWMISAENRVAGRSRPQPIVR